MPFILSRADFTSLFPPPTRVYLYHVLTLLGPQSRFEDKLLVIWVLVPTCGTAVLQNTIVFHVMIREFSSHSFFTAFRIAYLFLLKMLIVATEQLSIWGHMAGVLPAQHWKARASPFYRHKTSGLSPLVGSPRNAPTHATRSKQYHQARHLHQVIVRIYIPGVIFIFGV